MRVLLTAEFMFFSCLSWEHSGFVTLCSIRHCAALLAESWELGPVYCITLSCCKSPCYLLWDFLTYYIAKADSHVNTSWLYTLYYCLTFISWRKSKITAERRRARVQNKWLLKYLRNANREHCVCNDYSTFGSRQAAEKARHGLMQFSRLRKVFVVCGHSRKQLLSF